LYYRPVPDDGGPSWLTFLGHTKDSLWSVDLLRCESVALRTYWVLVVMDHYTRRIIGFGIQARIVDGLALCRMFNQAISRPPCSEISELRSRPAISISSKYFATCSALLSPVTSKCNEDVSFCDEPDPTCS